eukprot:15434949-Alexandrium_andersonii.AAC.1
MSGRDVRARAAWKPAKQALAARPPRSPPTRCQVGLKVYRKPSPAVQKPRGHDPNGNPKRHAWLRIILAKRRGPRSAALGNRRRCPLCRASASTCAQVRRRAAKPQLRPTRPGVRTLWRGACVCLRVACRVPRAPPDAHDRQARAGKRMLSDAKQAARNSEQPGPAGLSVMRPTTFPHLPLRPKLTLDAGMAHARRVACWLTAARVGERAQARAIVRASAAPRYWPPWAHAAAGSRACRCGPWQHVTARRCCCCR